MAYMRDEDYAAALELLEQTLDLVPEWPVPYFRMGELYSRMNTPEKAGDCFRRYLELDAADTLGAIIKLSLLGYTLDVKTLPAQYVETLFDQYAPRFDKALVETLDYRAPQLIMTMLQELDCQDKQNPKRILDLGCGTGLMGEAVFPYASWLDGVDISGGMVAQAAGKSVYHTLTVMDGTAYMAEKEAKSYDMVLAADVMVYIGDLAPVFNQVARILEPGGLFIFTCQKWHGEGFVLGGDHRFSHSLVYLCATVQRFGMELVRYVEQSSRKDGGKPVDGFVMAVRKPRDTVTGAPDVNRACLKKAFSDRQ